MVATAEPTQLYQVVDGDSVRSTSDQQSQQRFLNEVKYVEYYAKLIGDCLGMKTLELGVVEDADAQTAFRYVTGPDGVTPVVNGFLSHTRKPLTRLVQQLRADD